jgi:type II secretory pathway pseudopilin PulG
MTANSVQREAARRVLASHAAMQAQPLTRPRAVAGVVCTLLLIAAGTFWLSAAERRERERQLLFIGDQYRQAIERYYERSPNERKQLPSRLEDLVSDARFSDRPAYIQQLYPDPITRSPHWGLIKSRDGKLVGVHSLSQDKPAQQTDFAPQNAAFAGSTSYADWRFVFEPTDGGARPVPPTPAAPQVSAEAETANGKRKAPHRSRQPSALTAKTERSGQTAVAAVAPAVAPAYGASAGQQSDASGADAVAQSLASENAYALAQCDMLLAEDLKVCEAVTRSSSEAADRCRAAADQRLLHCGSGEPVPPLTY